MSLNFKKTVIAAVLASGATFASMPAANASCGLECWLSKTFSTNDYVGDWLKATFGGINYNDSNGQDGIDAKGKLADKGKLATKEETSRDAGLASELRKSDEIVSSWKSGKEYMDSKALAKARPGCKLPDLIRVVNKTKSPEAALKTCF